MFIFIALIKTKFPKCFRTNTKLKIHNNIRIKQAGEGEIKLKAAD